MNARQSCDQAKRSVHRFTSLRSIDEAEKLRHLNAKMVMGMSLGEHSTTRTVIGLAVGSRLLLLALFLLWRNVANPYDTSADLSLPCLSNASFWASLVEPQEDVQQQQQQHQIFWGQRIGRALQRTVVWDGVYYVRTAECGYEYEQAFAFSPALPLSMRLLSRTIFYNLIPVLGLRPTLALSGYVINNIAFVLAAYYLYRLSKQVLDDETQATVAVALFCFNPASTFYSAIYAESLFALFSFTGLCYFLSGARWTSTAFFGLSSGVRSNGILHAGFILFQALHKTYHVAFRQRRFLAVVPIMIVALVQTAGVVAPYAAFQFYGFTKLCRQEGISGSRPWCNDTIPHLYGFVQNYYWNVGYLRYFQVKQLPNFLLASPMLSLAIGAIITYANHQPRLFFLLGLAASPSTRAKVALMPSFGSKAALTAEHQGLKKLEVAQGSASSLYNTEKLRNRKGRKDLVTSEIETEALGQTGFLSPRSVCFLIQLCFMVATATFFMHVQVATRFLSVSPPIYWYGAYLISNAQKRKYGYVMGTVFLCYIGIGSLLFINFYPFT